MMKIWVFLVGLFLASTLQAEPVKTARPLSAKGFLAEADRCAKALYGGKDKLKYRHNWISCVESYRDVARRFPESDEAVWAIYRAARMLEKLYGYSGREQDLDDAVELYRRVANDYEKHRLADDAQYRLGYMYFQKKDLTRAYLEFLKVDLRYPQGDMRRKAQDMIEEITAIISKRENEKEIREAISTEPRLTQVQRIRHWSTPNYTRVVIDLERSVPFHSNLLEENKDQKKPRRLYLDLKDAYVSSGIESPIPIRDGLLRSARAAQYEKDTVRVVLDIDEIKSYKVFPLHDPFRIVVDVQGAEPAIKESNEKLAGEKIKSVRKGVRKADEPDGSVSLARQLGLSVRRIVIDPGHGGKDPGTYFVDGIKEKHVVLALAQILAKKVEDKLGCEAILTRDNDIFLSLETRTAFANMKKADLFISLHINAHKQADVCGLETYYLNMATDQRAVLVAARENATSEKNISDLQSILNDLMLNTKISESSRLAHDVQRGIVSCLAKRYGDVKNLGVKQAPFYVLIGAEMPAVLVETGFITHPTERKRLKSRIYLEILADGIVEGIKDYMRSISRLAIGG
ncbi:MAG: N-acetylmuramoyl-L-alanine amidase [Deltaproteobacteria bacterium]|nr:N-acetylmuramoyl-L-alanine amidase [Deltaproteobacteria bacterium]